MFAALGRLYDPALAILVTNSRPYQQHLTFRLHLTAGSLARRKHPWINTLTLLIAGADLLWYDLHLFLSKVTLTVKLTLLLSQQLECLNLLLQSGSLPRGLLAVDALVVERWSIVHIVMVVEMVVHWRKHGLHVLGRVTLAAVRE